MIPEYHIELDMCQTSKYDPKLPCIKQLQTWEFGLLNCICKEKTTLDFVESFRKWHLCMLTHSATFTVSD